MEEFVLASFRSRTQVMYFNRILTGAGIKSEVINTPREIAIGCGLSVKLAKADLAAAQQLYTVYHPTSFVGFYTVGPDAQGRKITAVRQSWTGM